MRLAEAASQAVDFPKTGTPVNLTSLPRPPSQERPDFLALETVDLADNYQLYYPSEILLDTFKKYSRSKMP
jgi:RNA-dependent RNA polymerase